MAAQQIVAAGGRILGTPVDDFVLGLARGRRVCVFPTADMEPDSGLVLFYDAFAHKAECSRLLFNPWPPSDPGSACPHYDGERLRRPRYRELVDEGFRPGWAADDGVALHFAGTELAEAVTIRPEARAYRVEPGSETPFETRLL